MIPLEEIQQTSVSLDVVNLPEFAARTTLRMIVPKGTRMVQHLARSNVALVVYAILFCATNELKIHDAEFVGQVGLAPLVIFVGPGLHAKDRPPKTAGFEVSVTHYALAARAKFYALLCRS